MKNHSKSERHHALNAVYPQKPRHIRPAPVRTRPALWTRVMRALGFQS